jgi:hypothetical protein
MNIRAFALRFSTPRRLPVQAGIVLSFLAVPFWLRMPYAPPTYDPLYGYGFLLTLPLIFTIFAWVLTGFPGLQDLLHDRLRLGGVLLLWALVGWMLLSVSWSFMVEVREMPNVAQSGALQWILVAAWTLVVACCSPPPRIIVAVLIFNAVLHGLIGGGQVALQTSLGLDALGEFHLNPAESGVSVVQSDGVRWLRPYGLQSHPNVFAGMMVIGLLACGAWIISPSRRRWLGVAVAWLILWVLLLTFSRSAWLGVAAGAFALLPLILPDARRAWPLVGLVVGGAIVAGGLFFALYQPYLVARVQVGESIEMRSVADRIVFTDFALRAASESPESTLRGIGISNFPWRSSYYLVQTDYDLRGNNVHHVWLSAMAETGLIGLSLFTLATMIGISAVVAQVKRRDSESMYRAVLVAGVFALAIIGIFDHYPWTMLHFQVMWWGTLAVGASKPPTAPLA